MLPPPLERAADRYIELEREVDRLMPPGCAAACVECAGPCCRAGMANQTIRCWWLREVSVRVHGRWWPEDWRQRAGCVALTPTGCLLSAGRPVNCRTWYCDAYLAGCKDLWQAVLCAFLSELLPQTMLLAGNVYLPDLTEDDGPAHAAAIAERIEWAHRLLGRAKTLTDPTADEPERLRTTIGLICILPGILSDSVRGRLLRDLPGWAEYAAPPAGG